MKNKKLENVIIRTRTQGCFTGELKSRKGGYVHLLNARQLRYLDVESSLAHLKMEKTKISEPYKPSFVSQIQEKMIFPNDMVSEIHLCKI